MMSTTRSARCHPVTSSARSSRSTDRTTMHVGVALFATDLASDVRDVARAAEDAGFESLFVAEHTHIPTSRRTPYPMGGELPDEYSRTLDPFVALTAAAAGTGRLR